VANRRGNPNWTRTPLSLAVPPTGASAFEHMVATLCLAPEEYKNSTVLRNWVRENKDHRYVPSELLAVWGLRVDSGV
jgi:hypothetical protein